MRLDLDSMTEVALADLLIAGRHSRLGFKMAIKAMRWAWKVFQVECFQFSHGALISSFLKTKVPHDRRESLPYPLIILIQWERRILQSNTPIRNSGFRCLLDHGLELPQV